MDDLRPELGCYGNRVIKTPNIDRLATGSFLFTNHFVQVPTCGASRMCLLTGKRPDEKAKLSNDYMEKNFHNRPESEIPETFVHHFRRNGYYTVGIGKISHYPDGYVYGYKQEKSNIKELPYSWDEMLADPGIWGTAWKAFFGYAGGKNRIDENKNVPPFEHAGVSDTGYVDGRNALLAIKKLSELKARKKPFLLAIGFNKPHLPFNAPDKYWKMYITNDIGISPNPNAPENVPLSALSNSGEFFNSYKKQKETGGAGIRINDDYAREIRHAYYAAVSYSDAQVGKILNELKRLELDKNTIVVLWGDHGWHLGDQTIWGKHTIFERSLNSPLLLKVPGKAKAGSIVNGLVETIDIYPTLCDLCGIQPPPDLDGSSFANAFNHPDEKIKEAAYSYWNNGNTVRTKRYRLTKYVLHGKEVIVLFDHQTDPHENKNIANEFPGIVQELLPILYREDRLNGIR